jgi:hypothetical protein
MVHDARDSSARRSRRRERVARRRDASGQCLPQQKVARDE